MMLRSLYHFFRAREGAAAVEFALLAPIMIVFLFSSVEIINMLQSNRRVENTAISVADVLSRSTSVTSCDLSGAWAATSPLMFPNSATGMDLRVTSISIAANGSGSVVWSAVCGLQSNGTCGSGGTYSQLSAGTAVPANELPSINQPGSSLIRVETTYDYQPIIGLFSVSGTGSVSRDNSITVMKHTAFRRSRLVDPIPRSAAACT